MRYYIIISAYPLINDPQFPLLDLVRDTPWYDSSISHEAEDVQNCFVRGGPHKVLNRYKQRLYVTATNRTATSQAALVSPFPFPLVHRIKSSVWLVFRPFFQLVLIHNYYRFNVVWNPGNGKIIRRRLN